MKLPCDNIDDFIQDHLHHYSVNDRNYERGQVVTLYSNEKEHDFEIMYVSHFAEHTVLHLKNVDVANKEFIGSYYAGTNPND